MGLKSMTGFGRAAGPVGEGSAEIVARSVNHRSLDLTVKVREADLSLEPLIRGVFSRKLSRGKVEVSLRVKRATADDYQVTLNEPLLEATLARLALLAAKFPVAARLEGRDILSIPQIFSIENGAAEFSPDEKAAVEKLAEEAADALTEMRETEGREIAAEIGSRLEKLRICASRLAARREEITRSIHETLRERVKALFPDVTFEAGRLEQEAALAAERSDVSEELQRLQAHLEQATRLIAAAGEPAGKRLDFLSQEILREINTLGSKARDLQLTRDVLEMKAELEAIREQIPNVE
ncbi:MAG TPA: YicC/YloC family endoribonuclease [Thermoanaerobaculia bacterium]